MWQLCMEIVLLALLMAYLLFTHHRRARATVEERKWSGKAFDAARLHPRIHRLRADYLSARRTRLSPAPSREKVADSIRQTLRSLAYFRNEPAEHAENMAEETSTGRR